MALLRTTAHWLASGAVVMALGAGCWGPNPDFLGAESGHGSGAGSAGDAEPGSTSSEDGNDATAGATSTDPTSASDATGDDTASSTTGDNPACGESDPPSNMCPPGCDRCENGECIIDCVGHLECMQLALSCPAGAPCRVRCGGNQVCLMTTIECPPGHACRVECNGNQACNSTAVNCGAGTCELECATSESCKNTEFNCGTRDSVVTCDVEQTDPPTVSDAGSGCACEAVGC